MNTHQFSETQIVTLHPMTTVSFANQKGGVGKTSLSVGTAQFLHHSGYRVLLIDLDSQQNATGWLLGRHLEPDEASIYDSLRTKKMGASGESDWPLSDLLETSELGFDFIPANIDLSSADSELANHSFLLADRLEELNNHLSSESLSKEPYDFCLIDCPPSLGTLVFIALTASDGLLVPIKADTFSMEGVGQLVQLAQRAKRQNSDLEILGLALNNLDKRFGATNEGVETVRKVYGDRVFETEIPTRARILEASEGHDIYSHSKGNDAHEILEEFTEELLERCGVEAGSKSTMASM